MAKNVVQINFTAPFSQCRVFVSFLTNIILILLTKRNSSGPLTEYVDMYMNIGLSMRKSCQLAPNVNF